MDKSQKIFDIIRFTADTKMYYGASIELPQILLDTGNYTKHTDVTIPIGHSRYGGPVVDLPFGIEYPKDLFFAAQLDLSKFSPFDKSGLLPKSGQLLFFANIRNNVNTRDRPYCQHHHFVIAEILSLYWCSRRSVCQLPVVR